MAKQLQIRGGTTVQHSTFTGALREITIDTDKDVVVVHDGTTVGGFPLAKQTSVDSKVDKVTSTDNAIVRFNGVTGNVQNSGVVIDDNNNVGIGVTPSAWANDGYTKALNIGRHGSISSSIVKQAANIEIGGNYYYTTPDYVDRYMESGWAANKYEQSAGNHKWYTAQSGTAGNIITWTNAMTLNTNGQLILGNTSLANAVLNVVDQNAAGNNSWAMAFQMKQSSSNGYPMLFLNSSGTTVGSIQTTATGTSYGVSSDYRLKEDWKPMENSISRLMELKPCNFKWKETGTRVDGFLAHELQEVVPEAATGVKDEMMEEEYEISPRVEATYDEEGNELTPVVEAVVGKREVPKYQGIDQSKLVPLLTSALQEQQQIINDLKARIEILESK